MNNTDKLRWWGLHAFSILLSSFALFCGCKLISESNAPNVSNHISDGIVTAGTNHTETVYTGKDEELKKGGQREGERFLYLGKSFREGSAYVSPEIRSFLATDRNYMEYYRSFSGKVHCIKQHPIGGIDNSILFNPVLLGSGAWLDFDIGVFNHLKDPSLCDGVLFVITVIDIQRNEQFLLFEKKLTDYDQWFPQRISLKEFAGRSISLVFRTEYLNNANYDAAYWGEPKLYSLKRAIRIVSDWRKPDISISTIPQFLGVNIEGGSRVDRGWVMVEPELLVNIPPDVERGTEIIIEFYALSTPQVTPSRVSAGFKNQPENEKSSYSLDSSHRYGKVSLKVPWAGPFPQALQFRQTLSENVEPPIIPIFIKCPVLRSSRTKEAQDAHSVILISVDTLRPDALGCFGNPQAQSPIIDKLSKSSVLFSEAYSNSNWTLPAHLTLFTGQLPSQLNLGNAVKNRGFRQQLDRKINSVTERYSLAGYGTIGITGGGFVGASYGFDKGFNYYFESFPRIDDQTTFLLRCMKHFKTTPYFLFLHTSEVSQYWEVRKAHVFPLLKENPLSWDGEELYRRLECMDQLKQGDFQKLRTRIVDQHTLETIKTIYQGAVRYTDSWLGTLVHKLVILGNFDDTWLIFVSDHGEGFGDLHDADRTSSWLHGKSLYNDQIKIPILVKPPQKTDILKAIHGSVRQHTVQLKDVYLLLNQIIDDNVMKREESESPSLLHLLDRDAGETSPVIYSENMARGTFSIVMGNYKLMYMRDVEKWSPQAYELKLFNLALDPQEQMRYGEQDLRFMNDNAQREAFSTMLRLMESYLKAFKSKRKELETTGDTLILETPKLP